MLVARISLALSRRSSLSFIALGRSSGQHPVSSHSCWMYFRASRPAFVRPCVGVHKSTSLMSSSLLLQQCPKYKYRRYERVYFFLLSVLGNTRRERDTQVIKAYTNHTTLIPYLPPPHGASLVSKISTHLCWSRPVLIFFDYIRKTQPFASTVKPQLLVFSKPSNSQDHLFRIRQPPTQFTPMAVQPHFLFGGLL